MFSQFSSAHNFIAACSMKQYKCKDFNNKNVDMQQKIETQLNCKFFPGMAFFIIEILVKFMKKYINHNRVIHRKCTTITYYMTVL